MKKKSDTKSGWRVIFLYSMVILFIIACYLLGLGLQLGGDSKKYTFEGFDTVTQLHQIHNPGNDAHVVIRLDDNGVKIVLSGFIRNETLKCLEKARSSDKISINYIAIDEKTYFTKITNHTTGCD